MTEKQKTNTSKERATNEEENVCQPQQRLIGVRLIGGATGEVMPAALGS